MRPLTVVKHPAYHEVEAVRPQRSRGELHRQHRSNINFLSFKTVLMVSNLRPSTSSHCRFFYATGAMAQYKLVSGAHALIFGASSLARWVFVDQLLNNYPIGGTFSKVTTLVNRPLKISDSFWPSPKSPKFELVSNVNLAKGIFKEFTALLKRIIGDIVSVTVFLLLYV
jgi:hypothetical protein